MMVCSYKRCLSAADGFSYAYVYILYCTVRPKDGVLSRLISNDKSFQHLLQNGDGCWCIQNFILPFFFLSLPLRHHGMSSASFFNIYSTSFIGDGGPLGVGCQVFFYHRMCDHVSKARWILLWMWMRLLFIMGVGENLYGDGSCGQISRS